MVSAASRSAATATDELPLLPASTPGDDEAALANALRVGGDSVHLLDRVRARNLVRGGKRAASARRQLAADVAALVEARLPGRIRELDVQAQLGELVLRGVANSYYVKQIAQTVAMAALDGERLVNQIEVRTVR